MASDETTHIPKALEETDWGNIAEGIDILSNATSKALDCGLTEYTIILLLWDATKVPKKHIKKILDVLPQLQELYLETPE